MEKFALILALCAVILALVARARANGLSNRIEDLESEVRRRSERVSEDVERELGIMKKLLARVAEGKSVSPRMIDEGRLWEDVEAADAAKLLDSGDVHVLDVRSPQETAGGVIPGAQLIPIDEIEQRFNEVPKDGRKKLVYCAGGGRSAAACEFLSQQGFDELHNLAGGISSWTGPTEKPS